MREEGGIVSDNRLVGETNTLAIYKSFGDTSTAGRNARPGVVKSVIPKKDSKDADFMLVMASDGMWNTLSPPDVATIAKPAFKSVGDAHQIPRLNLSNQLIKQAYERGSKDNITVKVIWGYS